MAIRPYRGRMATMDLSRADVPRPRLRTLAVAALVAASTVGVAACGSSKSSSGGSSGTTSSAGAGSSTAAASTSAASSSSSGGATSAAAAVVAAHRGLDTKFTPPGPAVNASSLKGKSIWYVPIGASIPVLQGEAMGMKQAATALGMTYRTCDGKLLASDQSACIEQAVNANAAGIITDSFDPKTVATAITYAKAHKVPVIIGNEFGPQTALDQYMTVGGDPNQEPVAMDWIIAHFGDKAKILSTTVIGDRGTEQAATDATAELKKNCSTCTQTVVQTTAAQLQNIGSAVSSSLLKDSSETVGFPQFDFLAPLFKQGMDTSGHTIPVVSTNAVLSQMQIVKSGGWQIADIGANRNYLGWSAMDRLVRMVLGKPAPTSVTVPVRVFDKTNIGSLPMTQAASLSGIWYGPITYRKDFEKLWGVS
jgi:ribose transport system substrate-binding protein